MPTSLPSGFQSGPLVLEREADTVELINAAYRWMNGGNFTTLENIQTDWHQPEFDMAADTHIVTAPDGQVVGYADIWDITALHVRWYSLGYVHPDFMGRGVGSHLLNWCIERGRHKVSQAPEGARVVLHQSVNSTNQAAAVLFAERGFQVARQSYRMRVDLDENTPAADIDIPPAIRIRPYQPGEERAMLWAAFDSFRDHWAQSMSHSTSTTRTGCIT